MSKNSLTAEWPYDDLPETFLRVRLAKIGVFEAYVAPDHDGELTLSTAGFKVNKNVRGHGIGTRLMCGAFALAKSYGVTNTSASIVSPAALRIRQKIFGEQIKISDLYAGSPLLPMSVSQAIQSLELSQEFERQHPYHDKELGFIVRSSLAQLNTNGWEIPVELNKPHVSELWTPQD